MKTILKTYARKSDATKLANKMNATKAGHIVKQEGETYSVYAPPTTPPKLRKSLVDSPVQYVWAICDEFYKHAVASGVPISRKRVIGFCLEQGVAFNTARTQYQSWKQTRGI